MSKAVKTAIMEIMFMNFCQSPSRLSDKPAETNATAETIAIPRRVPAYAGETVIDIPEINEKP